LTKRPQPFTTLIYDGVISGFSTVTLAGNHMSDHLVISQDSGTGTLITDPPAATIGDGANKTLASTANVASPSPIHITSPANAALFGSYMASLFPSIEGEVALRHGLGDSAA
jgi:hypothetical protein